MLQGNNSVRKTVQRLLFLIKLGEFMDDIMQFNYDSPPCISLIQDTGDSRLTGEQLEAEANFQGSPSYKAFGQSGTDYSMYSCYRFDNFGLNSSCINCDGGECNK